MSDVAHITSVMRQSLSDPAAAARRALDLQVPFQAVVMGLVLVSIADVLSQVLLFDTIVPIAPEDRLITLPPILFVVVLVAVTGGFSWLLARVGQALDGKGTFQDALTLMVLLELIIFVAQLVQLLILVVLPPLVWLYSLALFALAVWIQINFISVLHKVTRGGAVGILLLSIMAAALALILMATLAGVPLGGTG